MISQIILCASHVRVVGSCSGQVEGRRCGLSGAIQYMYRLYTCMQRRYNSCTGYAIHVQAIQLHVSICLHPRRPESYPQTWGSSSASPGLATLLKLTCWVCGTICQLWGEKEPGLTKLA